MKNIKTLVFALSVALLCLNSDCNKVEETPPITDLFIIEGRLVNSCTDNSPLKNRTFDLRDENDKIGTNRINVKTDSNGYFKIYSNLKGKNLVMDDGLGIGKEFLYHIPGGKSLNIGNVVYDFIIPLNIVCANYFKISNNDSLIILLSPLNAIKYLKGPFNTPNLGTIYIKSTPLFLNKDSITERVNIFINSLSNKAQTKYFMISNCDAKYDFILDF